MLLVLCHNWELQIILQPQELYLAVGLVGVGGDEGGTEIEIIRYTQRTIIMGSYEGIDDGYVPSLRALGEPSFMLKF